MKRSRSLDAPAVSSAADPNRYSDVAPIAFMASAWSLSLATASARFMQTILAQDRSWCRQTAGNPACFCFPPDPGYKGGHGKFPVAWSRSDRHWRGRHRPPARSRQHDARWLWQHVAEADALARGAAIRRHRHHHGHDLGDGEVRLT